MQTNTHRTGHLPRLPTGVEDTEGWAFKRARTHEVTLAPEEVHEAREEGVDVRALGAISWKGPGFVRFNGRWFQPATCTTVASGLDPSSHPGEFIRLDDAECMALERVVSHWRAQAAGEQRRQEMAASMRTMAETLQTRASRIERETTDERRYGVALTWRQVGTQLRILADELQTQPNAILLSDEK